MPRYCKIRIKIADGEIQDAITAWGLYLIDSDDTIIAPVREYEKQQYPEEAAAEIHPYTTLMPFEYKCTLLCLGSLSEVNTTVRNFYDSLFSITAGVDLRQAKPVTIYNDYKGIRVTGYAKTAEGNEYYPELAEYEKGAWIFDFILDVADPKTLLAL